MRSGFLIAGPSSIIATELFSRAGARGGRTGDEGYKNENGTYVQPHHRTNPNGNTRDSCGTLGNVNPRTGQVGTRTPKD